MSIPNGQQQESEARAIVETVERLAKPEIIQVEPQSLAGLDPELEKITVLAVPKGIALHSTKAFEDERRTAPERRTGTAKFTKIESFIEHARRFSSETKSAIFAIDSLTAPKLIAVLNYHETGHEGEPAFGDHRGVYEFPLSPEWVAWHKIANLEAISQATLAAFLEDHLQDVVDPAGVGEKTAALLEELGIKPATSARLLELSRGLSVRVDSKVTQHINPSTGEAQLAYEETHGAKDGGVLKVPDGFVIAIPVFRGGPLYPMVCRLRYRVQRSEGRVTWAIALHRADKVFEHAFSEVVGRACVACE